MAQFQLIFEGEVVFKSSEFYLPEYDGSFEERTLLREDFLQDKKDNFFRLINRNYPSLPAYKRQVALIIQSKL